jgi:hypothetical protein
VKLNESTECVYEDAEDTDPWSPDEFGAGFRACAAEKETGSCLRGSKSCLCCDASR